MGASLLITFRESLEASLVVGIVLGLLGKEGRRGLSAAVWGGLSFGVGASLVVAWTFVHFLGEFEGRAEQIFEGTVMLVGALLLASLVLWSGSHSSGKRLEGQVLNASGRGWFAVALLVFVSILREGVETVVYLGASLRDGGPATFAGGLIGIVLAVILGILILGGGRRVPTKAFFTTTTLLLVLFGAGLFSRAAGEYGEAGILPPLLAPLWNLAPLKDGMPIPLLNDEGAIGSFLKGLFGYSSSPSLSQVLAWLVYAGGFGLLLGRKNRGGVEKRLPGGGTAGADA